MANHQVQFKAMGVDPNSDSRLRLRQTVLAVPLFNEVIVFGALREAESKALNAVVSFDIIFVSSRFPQQEAREFITQARTTPSAQDAAFVLLDHEKGDALRDARSVLEGYDGTLQEPYSVDALVQICDIASKVKKQRIEERKREAIARIVREVVHCVDRVAALEQQQMDKGRVVLRLKEAAAFLKTLTPADVATFHRELADCCETQKPYQSIPGLDSYSGVSARIKKKLLQRLIAQEAKGS